jgi:hypothetical protein
VRVRGQWVKSQWATTRRRLASCEWGSIPSGPANPVRTRVSAVRPLAESAEKAPAHPLRGAVEAFLLTKQVAGCTQATLHAYRGWLDRLLASIPEATPLTVRGFFVRHVSGEVENRIAPDRHRADGHAILGHAGGQPPKVARIRIEVGENDHMLDTRLDAPQCIPRGQEGGIDAGPAPCLDPANGVGVSPGRAAPAPFQRAVRKAASGFSVKYRNERRATGVRAGSILGRRGFWS